MREQTTPARQRTPASRHTREPGDEQCHRDACEDGAGEGNPDVVEETAEDDLVRGPEAAEHRGTLPPERECMRSFLCLQRHVCGSLSPVCPYALQHDRLHRSDVVSVFMFESRERIEKRMARPDLKVRMLMRGHKFHHPAVPCSQEYAEVRPEGRGVACAEGLDDIAGGCNDDR